MVNYQNALLDRTFAALADPTRRALLARLDEEDGISISELARPFPVSLPAIMKHLDVLSDAGLIARSNRGANPGQSSMVGPVIRIKLSIRRFTRRHSWIMAGIRSFMIFSAAFGGAYGFIAGSRSENSGYNPHTFAIGASFLFALACVGLAALSFRLRWMRKKLRKIALHNEALADRNWELQEAEQRARSLFESQGDLIVLRDADGVITFVNDAYCELRSDRATP